MSILSQFVKHNAGWLAPAIGAVPFVGPTVAHYIDNTNAAGNTAAATQAAASAAAAQATADAARANAAKAAAVAPAAANNAILVSSPATKQTLMYVGGALALLLVVYLLMRRR